MKAKISWYVFWFVLITSFVFFAALIQLKANGWRLNFQTWQIVKTGMISLDGTPDSATVKINGKVFAGTLPTKIRDLAPGFYDVEVVAPNFRTWQKSIQIQPGQANIYQYIVLFLINPTEVAVPQGVTAETIKNEFQLTSTQIKIDGSQIYFQDKFVTRFSQNILAAIIYPDQNHIIFQQGNEIRAIDIDGSNNQLLLTLSSAEPTFFTIKNNSRTIYYFDASQVYGKNIN